MSAPVALVNEHGHLIAVVESAECVAVRVRDIKSRRCGKKVGTLRAYVVEVRDA